MLMLGAPYQISFAYQFPLLVHVITEITICDYHEFLTRIPLHPRKKLTKNENKSVTVYVKNNLQYLDHVFRSLFSDT